jgi:hypothetical protein
MAGKGDRYRPVDEERYNRNFDKINFHGPGWEEDGPRMTNEQMVILERIRIFKNTAQLWLAERLRRVFR